MAWINFTDFTGNSATFASDYLVGFIGVKEQKYPVVALKNGLSAGLFTAQNLLVTENTTIRGNLSVLGTASVFETIVSVTSALSVINTGTGPAFTVQQTGAQPIALFLDDNYSTFRIDDEFKVSFFNCHATGSHSIAEGNNTVASGDNSHAQGNDSISSGTNSHAQGSSTVALGIASHAQGNNTTASGSYSHAEGQGTATGRRNAFATYTAATRTFTFAPAVSANFTGIAAGTRLRGYEESAGEFFTITVASRSNITGAIVATADVIGGDSTDGYLIDDSGQYSHAEGTGTTASGLGSHAEGEQSNASGNFSHAEGGSCVASGLVSHAEGLVTQAVGQSSHAEGQYAVASGLASHAEGLDTIASGNEGSHAEGYETTARGDGSHAEGRASVASGLYSHAEGYRGAATGYASHVEGYKGATTGDYSHAEGGGTVTGSKHYFATYTAATRTFTFAPTVSGYLNYVVAGDTLCVERPDFYEGISTIVVQTRSTQTGNITATTDEFGDDDTFGWFYDNSGTYAHAEGDGTIASGTNSHAEGSDTEASGYASHAQGVNTTASGDNSHAEGTNTVSSGSNSHAEGNDTWASGIASHAEGFETTASGTNSHAEGNSAKASGDRSHAEGLGTTASGEASHAQGHDSIASGQYSHAQGDRNMATGEASHAEGYDNVTGRKNNFLTYTAATCAFTFANTVSANFAYVTAGMTLRGYEYTALDNYFNITVASRSAITGTIVATTNAIGPDSTSGYLIDNSGAWAHAEGYSNVASGEDSHAEGYNNVASGNESHAEGFNNVASGQYSHAQGNTVVASGTNSHAQGVNTFASGYASHAQGVNTTASGDNSHAEGVNTATGRRNAFATYTAATKTFTFAPTVSANFAFVVPGTALRGYEDDQLGEIFIITVASRSNITGAIVATADPVGANSTSGYLIDNSGAYSHAQGVSNTASGQYSHAEGSSNTASGQSSHAEGSSNTASGQSSHAEGQGTTARGITSHAAGGYVEAAHDRTWAWKGSTNTAVLSTTRTDQFMVSAAGGLFLNNAVGIGTDSVANALTVNGNISGTSGLAVDALTGRNISLVHVPANDGTNAFIQLGEFTTGSTTASAFSGFRLEYNENTNAFNLSSIFGAATTDVININNSGNVTANSVTARGTLSANGNVTGNQADFTNTTIRGTLSANGNVTVIGTISGKNTSVALNDSRATGLYSFACGSANTIASGQGSHAEGGNATAAGLYSHAEGGNTTAAGDFSHAEGFATATGVRNAFATYTAATRTFTFAPAISANFAYVTAGIVLGGYENNVLSDYFNIVVASRSNITGAIVATADVIGGNSINGYLIDNSGAYSHAEGYSTTASGDNSHAEGRDNIASGNYSHAEGHDTTASGSSSHAEGNTTTASGNNSHAEGGVTKALGGSSHAEGSVTIASNEGSHAEGYYTLASGQASHAEGNSTVASGNNSHAEGYGTATGRRNAWTAYNPLTQTFTFAPAISANFAYVVPGTILQGYENIQINGPIIITVASRNSTTGAISATADAIGDSPNSGYLIDNSGHYGHAEGYNTVASGNYSHAQGISTTASASGASTQGFNTSASGNYSHAAGSYAQAAHDRSWIWKGSTNVSALCTTRTDQFVVSAAGGLFLNNAVGINTDSVANALTVVGNISATGSITANNFTGNTPYTVTFTPFTSGSVGAGPGGTLFFPAALSGTIPSSELSTRFVNNRGSIEGVLFFANDGALNLKQYALEFAKDAAFTSQNTPIYLKTSGETGSSIVRPVNGAFVNGRIVMPAANATQPWGASGTLIEYPYVAGDSIYYRIGFVYPTAFENMGLSAGYIRIVP